MDYSNDNFNFKKFDNYYQNLGVIGTGFNSIVYEVQNKVT